MAIFDRFRKKEASIQIGDLIRQKYRLQFPDECRYIMQNYVPDRGQAATLQGELLREIENLRYEAQNNGNINWDSDFSYFCDFITDSLTAQPFFSKEDRQITRTIMAHFKACGQYELACANQDIPDEAFDPNKLAYTEDNLYDMICDQIGRLQKEHPEPIVYTVNARIKR